MREDIAQPKGPSNHTDPEVAAAIQEALRPTEEYPCCFVCLFYHGNQCRRHSPPWPGVAATDLCGDFKRRMQ